MTMGEATRRREETLQARTEEASRALARVGIMTHAQIARLLGVHHVVEQRVVAGNIDGFTEQGRISTAIARQNWTVPGNRVLHLVRLTREAAAQWAEREGLPRVPYYVSGAKTQAQRLNVAEVLIGLRHAGVLYEKWDMMLPKDPSGGVHSLLVRQENGFRLGLYLLPDRYEKGSARSIRYSLQNTTHPVVQSPSAQTTLFLVKREYYATALRVLSRPEVEPHFYLLPLESFMEEPEWYLEAIATQDQAQRKSLVDGVLGDCEGFGVPAHHDYYPALLKLDEWTYRFVDTWVNGSITRVRQWREDKDKYQVPGVGRIALANVYVYDETMRKALEKVVKPPSKPKKKKKKTVGDGHVEMKEEEPPKSIVDVQKWLASLVAPQSMTDAPSSFTEPGPAPAPQPESEVHQDELAVLADAQFDEEYAQFEARMADDSYWLEKQPSVPEVSKPEGVGDDVPKPESTARPGNRWSLLKKRR